MIFYIFSALLRMLLAIHYENIHQHANSKFKVQNNLLCITNW